MSQTYVYSLLGQNGNLGNQLWQIAGTYGTARKNGKEARFPQWDYAPYFNVPFAMFVDDLGVYPDTWDFAPDYLQDLFWWRGEEELIDRIFRPSQSVVGILTGLYEGEIYKRTAVHVRRANNLSLPNHHPVPPLEYFEAAIDRLRAKDLLVFSDDMGWCKKQSIFKDAMFSPGIPEGIDVMELTKYGPKSLPEAAYDLHAMSLCRSHVISNSSLSWWGAYLSGQRKVVYPSRWYGPALADIDTTVMFTGLGWIEMEFDPTWT